MGVSIFPSPSSAYELAPKVFIVMSANDWEREQELLYILQNNSLMQQISDSLKTHVQGEGYTPDNEQLDEILSI
jgi:antitoxin YefM